MEADELKGLVQAMTPVQKLRFKQAIVRQSIYYVSQCLPPEAEEDGHRGGIIAAMNWLNEPTEEKANDASSFAGSECWDGGVRYHDYPAYFLEPADTAGASDIYHAAVNVVDRCPPPEEREAARQWQLAAAHAILRGEEAPPLP